jgi:hypothetical protein
MRTLISVAIGLAIMTSAAADPLGNLLKQNAANANGATVDGVKPGGGLLGGSNVFTDIANWVGGDLTAAETLAVQNPALQDWTGYACWKAAETFVGVLKAHPLPLTLKAASDAEALRLATSAAKTLCQTSACQTVSGDLLGGIAQMGLGIPPPVTLQTLCAKIPSVTLGTQPAGYVATTPAPAPTPTGSP